MSCQGREETQTEKSEKKFDESEEHDGKQLSSEREAGKADIFVGTAGYNYSHWRSGVFYPRGLSQPSELRHYSGVFSAVEINATFHGVPREETVVSWVRDAKSGFRFGLKVPQIITHERKLSDLGETWEIFLERAQRIGEASLAPILFQLPPSLPKDISKLDAIADVTPCGMKIAFEFRNPSWYCSEVYDALRRRKWALCENISPDDSTIRKSEVTAPFCYSRFHKNGDRLATNYSEEQLAQEADRIVLKRRQGLTQYAFFLNDHEGNGPRNARTLMKFIAQRLDLHESESGLVSDWKPDPVVEKGGKGSIEAMFANARAKPTNSAKAKSSPKGGLEQFLSPSKRQKTTKERGSSSSRAKQKSNSTGKITGFFGKK